MLRVICLILATVIVLTIIVGLIKGKGFIQLVDNLNSYEYFLKDFYIIGFYLNSTRLFRMRGKLERNIKKYSKLFWDNIYAEYYANLAWAQFLTLSFLALGIGLIIIGYAGSEVSVFLVCILILSVLAIWNISILKIKDEVKKRQEMCDSEFPNMVSKLSLLINSGMVLRESWNVVSYGKEGVLYDLMRKSCVDMENGASDIEAIHKFGVLSDSAEIKKFTSVMIQGLEKGNSELSDLLIVQSSEIWAHKRQVSLQKGEIAAGKLIVPLGITFGGIILIIVAATMQSMSF